MRSTLQPTMAYSVPGTSHSAEGEDDEELTSALAFHRQELMAAKTLDSDLDLAFNLQMQEAVTASLSSSRSPSGSASENPTRLVKAEGEPEFDYLSLMLGDVERVAVERRDRKQSEDEMRRVKRELDRRIHDHKFANYIRDIPEEAWAKYGDNYERPYDGNVSSEMQKECFRLVCCGLVSEERVKDARVLVAAAGVVIHDSWGNVVLEIKKPLKGAETMSPEMAVLEGLLYGLNAALSLELTRLNLLCHDHTVYQYIASRSLARHSKTAELVNEFSSLRRKFIYCEPVLVTLNETKFAVKLARDAISSQIIWPAENGKGKQKLLKETCVICFEGVDVDRMFTVDGCFHRFCFSCMKQHVEVKLKNGLLAECPHEGCKSAITVEQCSAFLDPRLVQMLSERRKEASIPVTDKVYCPYPKCSALMSKHEALKYTKSVYVGAENSGTRLCKTCHQYFCSNCKVPWHYSMTCSDYKRKNPGPPTEDSMLKSLAKRKLWRECVKCKHMIELAEGCYHITCRCGHEFCYTCGAEWRNKKPTCSCKLWEESYIMHHQGQQRR